MRPDRHPTGSILQSQRNKALLQNNGETAENILRIAPNLISGKKIIPEMLVHMCTPKLVGRELGNILPGRPGHDNQLEGYREMRAILGTNDAPSYRLRNNTPNSQTESNNDYRHPGQYHKHPAGHELGPTHLRQAVRTGTLPRRAQRHSPATSSAISIGWCSRRHSDDCKTRLRCFLCQARYSYTTD